MMKFFVISLCISMALCLPPQEDTRQGRNILTDLLGNIGILRVIPRSCTSTSSLLRSGMCAWDADCTNLGGAVAGECARIGSCCVVPAVCNSATNARRSWYINKGFPGAVSSYSDQKCELTIQRADETIKQVRLDFELMELSRSDHGACIKDSFHVIQVNALGDEVELSPPLCGDNKGQHMYVNMPVRDDYKLLLRTKLSDVSTEATPAKRQWRVLITQLDETEKAPDGCLQYYDQTTGQVRSLNYDASESNFVYNQEYDVCFRSLDLMEEEQAEADPDKTAIHSCSRSAFGVNVQQSFVDITELARVRRDTVKQSGIIRAEETKKAPMPSVDTDDKTEIEQVLLSLSGNQPSGLMSVVNKKKNLSKNKVAGDDMKVAVKPMDEKVAVEKVEVETVAVDKKTPVETEKKVVKVSTENKKVTSEKKPLEETKTSIVETLPVEQVKPEVVKSEPSSQGLIVTRVEESLPDTLVISVEPEQPSVNDVEEPIVLVSLPQEEVNVLTPEMEVALEAPDCGGNYLLVKGLRVCGSFFRTDSDSTKRDVRFANVERMSLRSLGDPATALRFDMDFKVSCVRSERPTTTTTTEPSTTTKPGTQRRVNILQYILGLY